MKLGIVSDIHANLEALEAALSALRDAGATRFVCCGDTVGYGPDPNRCVELIRELGCVCVAGNHDYGVMDRVPLDVFNPAAARAALWTRPLLTESNRAFLADLPLATNHPPLIFVHSSPSNPAAWDYVLTVRQAGREMEHYSAGVCVVGHSHQPFAAERLPGAPARLIRQDSFRVLPEAKYFVNAGSVGQPRDGDPRACCMLYDEGTQMLTYLRVPYEISSVQSKIRAAGLPDYLASRLAIGR